MDQPTSANNTPNLLGKVQAELARYTHHLLEFSAEERDDAIHLLITARGLPEEAHIYDVPLHPRDLEGPRFSWALQRMLYDFMHDYLVELFITTPQSRDLDS